MKENVIDLTWLDKIIEQQEKIQGKEIIKLIQEVAELDILETEEYYGE